MSGWAVAAGVLLALWLLARLRLGVQAAFLQGQPQLVLRLGTLPIRLLPAREKPESKKARRPERDRRAGTPKKERPVLQGKELWRLLLELLPMVGEAAGTLRRQIRIDHLMLHLIWADPEPDGAALGYGRANGAIGMLWPLLAHNFQVKSHDLWVDLDYGREQPELEVSVSVSMTLGQLMAFGVGYGIRLLKLWSRSRRRSAKKQEVQKV